MTVIAPRLYPRALGTISTQSIGSIGDIARVGTPASGTWPSANRGIFIPFRTTAPITVRQLFVYNGATAAGNIDMGIYDAVGTRLVSIGPTAQSGTSVLQIFDITDTQIGVGMFYLALVCSLGTATVMRSSLTPAGFTQAMGIMQQASVGTLPANATFAASAFTIIPVCGLTTRTVL